MKAKTGLTLFAVAASGLLAALVSYGKVGADGAAGKAAPTPPPRPALAVTLVSPRTADWPRMLEASGGLFAWQEGVIAAETGGLRVVEVAVDVGDRVRRGQVLARLDQETVKAQLAQQEARVAQVRTAAAEARANGDRARNVKDKGAMSEQQVTQYLIAEEGAKANLAAAEAALEMERIRLADTRVLAVDDGVISARGATLGTVVQPGTELFRIVRQGRVEWRAELTAAQLAQIRPGQEAEIRLPGGESVTGKVRIASPTLDATTRYGLVYVDLPPDSVARPGMFAQGTIRVGASQALTLPESSVVLRDGSSFVFEVLADDRVAQRKVETGRRAAGQVEILSGLNSAARVVESGGAFLADGDLVRVEVDTGSNAGIGRTSAAR
ncbi:efflux RND transporter periplasmic adaptor subunit [uncultured Thiodictyon sp.]|uniref:efflux RND transporter periplasmic adaptor subunit n=1 Tax=uncultured Thiodictyon sp. TaxID=1846217 RepID=UPI0025CBF72E|nr:efflux RND transporter periplasmic adaptor subunit [uncultured Thiodictyon sp.]